MPRAGATAFVIMGALVSVVCAIPSRERWIAAWDLLAKAGSAGHMDLAALAGHSLAKGCMTHRFPPPPAMVSMAPFLKKIGGFGR